MYIDAYISLTCSCRAEVYIHIQMATTQAAASLTGSDEIFSVFWNSQLHGRSNEWWDSAVAILFEDDSGDVQIFQHERKADIETVLIPGLEARYPDCTTQLPRLTIFMNFSPSEHNAHLFKAFLDARKLPYNTDRLKIIFAAFCNIQRKSCETNKCPYFRHGARDVESTLNGEWLYKLSRYGAVDMRSARVTDWNKLAAILDLETGPKGLPLNYEYDVKSSAQQEAKSRLQEDSDMISDYVDILKQWKLQEEIDSNINQWDITVEWNTKL
jgi:hypothetical protein